MADNTIIQQGKFTADGEAKYIYLRSDVDWLEVINYTQAATQQATGRGVKFYWQRGMSSDTGLEYKKTNNTDALNLVALSSGGFTWIDSTVNPLGAVNTSITAISTAATPAVSATSTTGMTEGCVVRLINVTGAQQLGGIDFTTDTLVTNTSFNLSYMAQLGGAGTTGSFRVVNRSPYIFYPRYRFISKITAANPMVVTLTVDHDYTVGQSVRISVPSLYGMIEADGLVGNITAINTTTNTITLDIDSSAFTAFAFPTTDDVPFTPALITPVGEVFTSPELTDDAVYNTAYIAMKLASGVQSPAGSNNDVIYWRAGKSFSDLVE